MPTHETDSQTKGLGGLGKKVAEHARSFVRLELELAALEVKKKVTSLAVGIGLGVGAAIFAVFGLAFLFATVAAALATFLATWLALLAVTLGLFVLTGILGLLAIFKIKKGTPPVPEQAIHEAKIATEALKNNGR